MTKTLKLAKDLELPADEAVTQKYGFIGRSGSGKSYAAMRLAELFLSAGAQVIALDWVGIWWSLRLNADGKRPGFEHVYIFGGEHADVDLRPESGALMADLVVDKHISVVLDVMHFRKAERTRFATAFAEQFFHRKKTARTACHLFIEEAQAYLPQMVRGDEARMVGVFEDIGKVGRNYGIGNSLISQRPQAINKDVLNQIEVLLAFQTNGPQERKAIAGWTAENTSAGAAMMQSLPSLEVGHALAWSPQWLRVAKPIHITTRETYNSSSTPTSQAKAIAPKTLAKSDLDALGDAIRATVEKAKADDPKELRKQLAEVRAELAQAQRVTDARQAPATVVQKTVEVLTEADRALLLRIAEGQDAILTKLLRPLDLSTVKAQICEAVQAFVDESDGVKAEVLDEFAALFQTKRFDTIKQKVAAVSVTPVAPQRPGGQYTHQATASHPATVTQTGPATGERLEPAKQRILNALAWLEQVKRVPWTREVVAFVAGASSRSSAFANNVSALRTGGYLEYPQQNCLTLTPAGRGQAVPPAKAITPQDLHAQIEKLLEPAQWRLAKAVIDAYPKPLTREALAERAGASAGSSAFANNVSRLRTLGLLDYPRQGEVVGTPVLFLEA